MHRLKKRSEEKAKARQAAIDAGLPLPSEGGAGDKISDELKGQFEALQGGKCSRTSLHELFFRKTSTFDSFFFGFLTIYWLHAWCSAHGQGLPLDFACAHHVLHRPARARGLHPRRLCGHQW
jgi:hypothetical protein